MGRKKLMEKVEKLLEERGRKAYEVAKEEILREEIEYEPVRDALEYFIGELWHNFQHPALLSLACKSVGGKPEDTTLIGAALVLLTGAADIHDDLIDQSKTKGPNQPYSANSAETSHSLLAAHCFNPTEDFLYLSWRK